MIAENTSFKARKAIRPVLCSLVIVLTHILGMAQTQYFVSPKGSASNTGTQTQPMKEIRTAFTKANPGDTIFLLPGKYLGSNKINNVHGSPNKPITVLSYDPTNLAVIDAQSAPSNTAVNPGLALENCSWINICGIKFENCWNRVVDLKESHYISIQYCHFTTGKWVVHPHGSQTHHILVENCIVHHPPQVWKGWSWLEIHHGELEHYNGALLHPRKSGGGHIMRNNVLRNLFNGFRTRPASIKEDGNTEIYGNKFFNIRDNEFEPESWAWNMHYYHNDHVNVHKLFSIDGVEGGNIYISGNTYTQSNDPWTNYQVSGIYKYKGGPLTSPCYVFNNSYYTTGRVMKYGESSNHLMKHFNNAYQFFETKDAFRVVDWQPGYEFDYDCINQQWSENIQIHHQEQNGLANTLAGFTNPEEGDFSLRTSSPVRDRGKVMYFKALDWRQPFIGAAPDIGAFEGSKRVAAPPFRFVPSPEGAYYEEYPRITRHYVLDHFLLIHLSSPLREVDLKSSMKLFLADKKVDIESIQLFHHGYDILVSCDQNLESGELYLDFDHDILGLNDLPLIGWGSTLPVQRSNRQDPVLNFENPWSPKLPKVKKVDITYQIDAMKKVLTVEMKVMPKLKNVFRGILGFFSEDDVYLDGAYPTYTKKGGIYTIDISNCKKGKYELVLLVAGEIFRKKIVLE